jgi:hypothetical protein
VAPEKRVQRAALSAKAGRPPMDAGVPARVRRRRKTAHASVQKETTLLEAAEGPRVLWRRTTPKVKKGWRHRMRIAQHARWGVHAHAESSPSHSDPRRERIEKAKCAETRPCRPSLPPASKMHLRGMSRRSAGCGDRRS